MHAAALVRAARALGRGWRFHGMTGPRVRALGADTVFDFTAHAAMLGGVFKVAGKAWAAMRAVERSWRERRPDLVVFLDSPALHLPLAKRAKRLGLKVLYYIAPQTWASREGRVKQMRAYVDKLACILPFEEPYFRKFGVDAEYVGHPLFESLAHEHAARAEPEARTEPEAQARVIPDPHRAPILALLPGSRRHVIDAVLPLQLEVVRRLGRAALGGLDSSGVAGDGLTRACASGSVPGVTTPRALVSCAAEDRLEQIRAHVQRSGVAAEIVVADNARVLRAADLALVASGTATLHVAYYRKPMIVMYDAGRWLHGPYELAGRLVVKSPHLSLLNVLANARIVPEFMPFIDDVAPIVGVARQLLTDRDWRELMIRQIDETVHPLERTAASGRVCELIAELLDRPLYKPGL